MSRIKAAVIQTAPEFARVEANIDDALSFVPEEADLAVLPELFKSGFTIPATRSRRRPSPWPKASRTDRPARACWISPAAAA